MEDNLLGRIKRIDPVILTDVVRKDQRSPFFVITEWSVVRLSDMRFITPDGLWLYSGQRFDKESV